MANFVLSAFADEAGAPLAEQIRALQENGIGYIEPRNIGGKSIADLTDEELRDMRHVLDDGGIRTGSIGSPVGKFPIHEPFSAHEPVFRRCLAAAHILGTDKMRMFSFFVGQDELAACRDEVMERLCRMVEIARAEGVTLCHENESRIYGQMPAEVKDILDTVPGLYGIFDPANYIMNGADVTEGIRATLTRFAYMHIKDAIHETHTIVPAGEGEGKIGQILDTVNDAVSGTVMLTLEPHLHLFDAYKSIDTHELKGKYNFRTNREAFDCAADALRGVLTAHGYRKDENNQWKK